MLYPPCLSDLKAGPKMGGDFRALRIKLKRAMASPPKKRRKAPTCCVCYTVGCAASRCKNLDAIIAGTWIPPAAEDLPMDPVVDNEEFDPEETWA